MKVRALAGQTDWAAKRKKWRVGEFSPQSMVGGLHRYNADVLGNIRDREPKLLREAINTRLWDAEAWYYKRLTPWLIP